MPFPFVPLAIAGLGALSGALTGRKKTSTQQATQFGTTTGTSRQTTDLTNMPVYSEEDQRLKQFLTNQYRNRLMRDVDLSGYTAGGLRNINRTANVRNRLLQNTLTSRGLSYSPVAATAEIGAENERLRGSTDFLNQIPLLREQLEGQKLQELQQLFSSFPYGQRQFGTTEGTTTGTSNQTTTGTMTQPGDVLGGLFTGLGQGLSGTLGYSYRLNQLAKLLQGNQSQPSSNYSYAQPGLDAISNARQVEIILRMLGIGSP